MHGIILRTLLGQHNCSATLGSNSSKELEYRKLDCASLRLLQFFDPFLGDFEGIAEQVELGGGWEFEPRAELVVVGKSGEHAVLAEGQKRDAPVGSRTDTQILCPPPIPGQISLDATLEPGNDGMKGCADYRARFWVA